MKKVAVVVRDKQQQYEALRTSLGALLESHGISFFVLGDEIEMTEEFRDNLDIFAEMDGLAFSDNAGNVSRHGLQAVTLEETAARLAEADIVIPFH